MVRIAADGKTVYFAGTIRPKEYMKEGPQPFLEKLDFETGKKERFFEGKKDKYETASLLNDDASAMLVNRESATEVGQTYFVSLPSKIEKQLTDNQVYNRDLVNAVREYITVTRNDGKTFRVKVTMMPGAFRRPAFFWFYPSEHRDQAAYDRGLSNVNINSFPSVSGANKAILLRAGYVYVEPDCPIFGERPNDSYVPQLRNNLSATIDALHEKGWVDRQKLAIGGHSYGGFSTLNAMIHTPFFKAGIAGASNTNRLLTPFGFQSESRMLWEGREMYLDMSPILHAEQLSGAVLLYHGAEDQNVGTALNNSERMFLALESLGKTSALYVYPYEDHGQVARETVLDQWARWIAWLDKYVK